MGGGGFSAGGGLFGNILGPRGLGLTGSGQTSNQTTQQNFANQGATTQTFDPGTQAFNNYLVTLATNPGMSPQFSYDPNNVYNISGTSQNALNNLLWQGIQPSVNPQAWLNQAVGSIDPFGQQAALYGLTGQNQQNILSNLQNQLGAVQNQAGIGGSQLQNTLANYLGYGGGQLQGALGNYLGYGGNQLQNVLSNTLGGTGAGLSNALQGNLNYINQQISPELQRAGSQYFGSIVSPQLSSQFGTMGLARSGANQEAQAKAAASIALPIQQQIAGLQSGALSQYNQNLANMYNQAYGQYGSGLQNLIGSAYGQYGTGLQNLVGSAYGQYGQGQQNLLNQAFGGLNQAYGAFNQGYGANQQQGFGAQQGLGQQYLSSLAGLQQAEPQLQLSQAQNDFARLLQGYQASLTPQQMLQQGTQQGQNLYESLLGTLGYHPGQFQTTAQSGQQRGTAQTLGTTNQGLLNTLLG